MTLALTGPGVFRAAAAALVAAARAGDPNLSVLVRQAMRHLERYHLPIGLKVDDALVGLMPEKLQGVNMWMNDWRKRSYLRKKWGTHLRLVVCDAEEVASFAGLESLGRAPACRVRMTVQIVRLVPSVREFLKDDDSLAGAPKQLYDAMKDQHLIREDRREWLQMLPPVQDVSPSGATPVTVFFLWPAPPSADPGGPRHVHDTAPAPADQEGRAEAGKSRRRRRASQDVLRRAGA
jgi:hypothetical protein